MAYSLLSNGCYDLTAKKFVDGKYCGSDCAASPSNPACKPPGPGAADYIGAVGTLFGTLFGPKPAPAPMPVQSGPSMMTIALLAGAGVLAVVLLRS